MLTAAASTIAEATHGELLAGPASAMASACGASSGITIVEGTPTYFAAMAVACA